MTRTSPRPRRQVGPMTIVALRPFLRYSPWRDAYVLRGIGDWAGPVFQRRAETHRPHFTA